MTLAKNNYAKYICCPNCKIANKLVFKKHTYNCNNCSSSFPYLSNLIPIFIRDAETFLTKTYQQYARDISQYYGYINHLESETISSPYRTLETCKKITEGLKTNLSYIQSLQQQLLPYVKIDLIVNSSSNQEFYYSNNFNYLRRDWAGKQEGENEISTIKTALLTVIDQYLENPKKGASVFLGAGTGRLVWEFRNIFETVFAFDNSYTMASMYYSSVNSELNLYEINFKNAKTKADLANPFKASLASVKNKKKPDDNIPLFFVGNTASLPFINHSLSVVFSVYFTDIMPLPILIKEIKRILKPNGLFIHFGPLQYHFTSIIDMLSAEEVRQGFENEGFEILFEKNIALSHYKSNGLLANKHYNNWFFTARKKITDTVTVSFDTVLELVSDFDYLVKGKIDKKQTLDEDISYFINLPSSSSVKGSELIIEMARRIDGTKSMGSIITEIERDYDFKLENYDDLYEFGIHLVDKNVFRIKN